MENWQVCHSGILAPGCKIAAASLPFAKGFKQGVLEFSAGRNRFLTLNAELVELVNVEIVGNGILFSLKTPGQVFRYKCREFQHLFVNLGHPKEVAGRTYYGGQSTTFHNTGGKIDSDVVDLHQALLRQILFGSFNKSLLEELVIQTEADVFIDFAQLSADHNRLRLLLDNPGQLYYSDPLQAAKDFDWAAQRIKKFAEKLENHNEALLLEGQCLFGQLQAAQIQGATEEDQHLCQLHAELLEKAQSIEPGPERRALLSFFKEQRWEVSLG